MKAPDDVRRELVRQWLGKARNDLAAAERLVHESEDLGEIAGFHAQQAAEKYLKALLTWHQLDFPRTHDLGRLLDLAAEIDEPLAQSLRDAELLTPYGVAFRYPGDADAPDADAITHALRLARKLRDVIVASLPEPITDLDAE